MRSLKSPAALRIYGVVLALIVSACETYDRPLKPLPPTLRFIDLQGRVQNAASLRGKPWVMALWAPGCAPCVHEMPLLEKVREEYEARGVGFMAVSLEPDQEIVARSVKRLNIRLPVFTVTDEVLAPLGVWAIPSVVFVNSEGVVVAAATGERSLGFLEKRAAALLE